jgi:hypothetical protein
MKPTQIALTAAALFALAVIGTQSSAQIAGGGGPLGQISAIPPQVTKPKLIEALPDGSEIWFYGRDFKDVARRTTPAQATALANDLKEQFPGGLSGLSLSDLEKGIGAFSAQNPNFQVVLSANPLGLNILQCPYRRC